MRRGEANIRSWGKGIGNVWRTSGDITPSWTRMLHTFDSASTRALYAQPGSWNDPDMLFIGAGDFDEKHLREARSHFSLWSIVNAPLLIGYDLRRAPKELLEIWGNADAVAINQDPAGNQGVIAYQSGDVQIIVKTLSDPGRKAVVLFNRGLRDAKVTLTANHLKFASGAPVVLRDLWSKATLAGFNGQQEFALAPRESRMFVATGQRSLANGIYLSEMPGSVHVAADGVEQPEVDPTIHQMMNPWGATTSTGERSSYAGWGGAQADAAPYGTQIEIAGRHFDTGLGVLASSRFEVRADRKFNQLTAMVGIDDASRNRDAAVEFIVYGDGQLLARSGPVAFGAKAVELKADVSGRQIVELIARQSGSGAPASVAWGDAALLFATRQ